MSKMEKLLTAYKAQTGQIFSQYGRAYNSMYQNMNSPVLFDDPIMKHDTGVGATNDVDLWFVENGLFADCCLDNPVMSLLCRPLKSFGMLFPVLPNNEQVISRASLVGNYDLDGNRPDGVCDPGPAAGDFGNCIQEFRKGRISMTSRTAELDALIENACRGINRERFYFVGGQRGVPGPVPMMHREQTQDIFRYAMYREFHAISNRMNMDLMKAFWSGDEANSTGGGGYKEFRGLLEYVVDDYEGGKDWVTASAGQDCSELNSDVKTLDACASGINAAGDNLYALLEELEYELTTRASLFGVTADWAIVAPSIVLRDITRALPCQMISGQCGTGATGVDVVANDSYLVDARKQMQREQTVDINGKSYMLVEDDFMPVVETDNGDGTFSYTSDIMFLPVRINGQPTIEWHHKDYRGFANELAFMGDAAAELRGYSDDGIYHSVVQRDMRCFRVDVKAELGLVLHAGFSALAGKVVGVQACMSQRHKVPNLIA